MLKSFIGPFVATFFISMFVLIMQFLWRMIDETYSYIGLQECLWEQEQGVQWLYGPVLNVL